MDKIVCFHGCDYKTGTTMISRCVSEQLAKDNPQAKVLLLHLANRESMEYTKESSGAIDDLHNSLKSGIFTTSHLLNICGRNQNLYTLAGLREFFIPDDVKYMPDMAIGLIETVKSDFDYIIIDAGNNIFWGLTMGALLTCGRNYLMIRQDETYIRRCEEILPHYAKLGRRKNGAAIKMTFAKLIINKYRSDKLYSKEYIMKRLTLANYHTNTEQVSKEKPTIVNQNHITEKLSSAEPIIIPYHAQAKRAEIDKKSLLAYKDKGFEKSIKGLLEDITDGDAGDNAENITESFGKKISFGLLGKGKKYGQI